MTQPITAKSPSEILEEFDRDEQRHNSLVYSGERSKHEREFLLSAMRSLLEHVVEALPEKLDAVTIGNWFGIENCKGSDILNTYNSAIDECISTIRKVQESLGE
jgi:hypothetical protein